MFEQINEGLSFIVNIMTILGIPGLLMWRKKGLAERPNNNYGSPSKSNEKWYNKENKWFYIRKGPMPPMQKKHFKKATVFLMIGLICMALSANIEDLVILLFPGLILMFIGMFQLLKSSYYGMKKQ